MKPEQVRESVELLREFHSRFAPLFSDRRTGFCVGKRAAARRGAVPSGGWRGNRKRRLYAGIPQEVQVPHQAADGASET